MNEQREPTVWASIGQTINLGNFENIKIDIGLSGIRINATDEFLNQQLDQAGITIEKLVLRLAEEIQKRRQDVKNPGY